MAIKFHKPRRLVQMTPYSYMISIPKLWMDQFGLKKGSYVSFEINEEKELVLRAYKEEKNETAELEVMDDPLQKDNGGEENAEFNEFSK